MIARDRFAPPSQKDASAIQRMMVFVDAFRQIEPSMPTSYVAAFLSVAHDPGQGVTKYARDLGVITPVASRILLEIGKKARTGGPGLGLVDSVQATNDLRAWSYFLTPKGVKLLDKLVAMMEGKHNG